jgi:anti-sigma regulatory factor (Ser/Thr protein kinase)
MAGMGTALTPHDHLVHFYDADDELIREVSAFLADGLSGGGTAVAIAAPERLSGIVDALASRGFAEGDRFRTLDAAEALGAFMIDGRPDRERFREVIGTVVSEAGRSGTNVRAFGEMVSLLWDRDNVAAAVELEGLWNELGTELDFFLYCAYPISSLAAADDLRAATEICARHSDVVAPPSYLTGMAPGADGPERSQVFVPTRSATTGARRFVIESLRSWGLDELVPDASIVISELAANAVLHAASAFRVSITRAGSKVRIAVEDADTTEPNGGRRATDGSGGFGMTLVERLSSTMGLQSTPDGKTVWAYVGR